MYNEDMPAAWHAHGAAQDIEELDVKITGFEKDITEFGDRVLKVMQWCGLDEVPSSSTRQSPELDDAR